MASQGIVLLGAEFDQILAIEQNLPADFGLGIQKAHNGQRGDGFAATGLADQAHRLAGTHREAQVIHNIDVSMTRKLDA